MDEHRLGLKPVIRRVWASPGYRPTAMVHHRYEWLYLYGFVQPTTGQNFWLLLPTVSIAAFNLALQEFAAFVRPGPDKLVRLLVDRAGWHTSPSVIQPPAMRLLFQPAYSPELQPAEHIWRLSDQPLLNRYFATLASNDSRPITAAAADCLEVFRRFGFGHHYRDCVSPRAPSRVRCL